MKIVRRFGSIEKLRQHMRKMKDPGGAFPHVRVRHDEWCTFDPADPHALCICEPEYELRTLELRKRRLQPA